jgi:hypothetical protein
LLFLEPAAPAAAPGTVAKQKGKAAQVSREEAARAKAAREEAERKELLAELQELQTQLSPVVQGRDMDKKNDVATWLEVLYQCAGNQEVSR